MRGERALGPYRRMPVIAPEGGRPPERHGAAVVVAVCTWLTFVAARSPLVLLGAMALTVPVVARRID